MAIASVVSSFRITALIFALGTALGTAGGTLAGATLAQAAPASALPKIVDSYVELQEALASDALEPAQKAAKSVVKAARSDKAYTEIAIEADKLAQSPSLEEARKSFKTLSERIIPQVTGPKAKGKLLQGREVMRCTMYPGDWIQKSGEPRNPYYGKSMLKCGEPLKTGQ